ncbi:hypothetical protein F2Q69_00031361 [Brassica cretica]|uniref:Replication protein A 70 kDa DNA-binding subunit B/D first OB fold domain-containing protein n=1 Tax=Brassica cretica TaxID=69181 RepID=A0A8S9S692_BRACR|nr:hypothetical protein F2Q69_00031361 [Brassica cretica]
MAAFFDDVNYLNPSKTSWKIKVKIIRLWRQHSRGTIDSIEMVLVDSNGDTIHATVNESVVPIFEAFLEEDDSRIFINIKIAAAGGSYRLTRHPYKVEFQANTRIRFCDDLPYRLTGLTPAKFLDILDGSLSPDYLIVEIVSLNGKDTEMISIELKNENDVRLPLVVWGNVALDLSEAIQLLSDKTLICVVKFGKIKVWKDERSVCNAYNVSAISLNPYIKEVQDFAKFGGTFELDVRCMVYCTKCKQLNPKLQRRYKLHMVVLDNTGHTKLLALDNIALQLLHQPIFHPTTHITSEILEPNVLRTALTSLVGKTYLFKILIDKGNYHDKDDTFKVQKIITSPYMINEFDVSSYPKGRSNSYYPDFSYGSEDPEGPMLIKGRSVLQSKMYMKTPAKREGSPIATLEAAFYQSADNKHGHSESIKKVKTEIGG